MPATARAACTLPTLPPEATRFDLELAYVARGAEIVACEARRALAVGVHDAEHADEDAWLERERPSLLRRLAGGLL